MVWDSTLPIGSEAISNGDNRIRELKADIQTSLRGNTTDGLEAKFPGSDTSNPIFRYRGLRGATGARPATGQYGLFVDTTRNVIQRDNGSSWNDIATLIPAGTKMLFIQAAVPTGWTIDATHDGRLIRVDGATGNTTGGASDVTATITLAHSHTVTGHTHTISSDGSHTHTVDSHTHTGPSHTHTVSIDSAGGHAHTLVAGSFQMGGGSAHSATTTTVVAHVHTASTGAAGTGVTGGATPGTDSQGGHSHGAATGSATPGMDSQLSNFTLKYVDVVVGTKD